MSARHQPTTGAGDLFDLLPLKCVALHVKLKRRQQLQPARYDVDASPRHRPADRHRGREIAGAVQLAPRGDDRRLGGAIGVQQPAALPYQITPDVQPVRPRLLAAEDHQPCAGRPLQTLRQAIHQLVPVGGGQVGDVRDSADHCGAQQDAGVADGRNGDGVGFAF